MLRSALPGRILQTFAKRQATFATKQARTLFVNCSGLVGNRYGLHGGAGLRDVWQRPSVGSQARSVSVVGVPRELDSIVKLDLLNRETSGRIVHIWMEYHQEKESSVAAVLTKEEFTVVSFRSKKWGEGHFVVVAQYQKGKDKNFVLFTHLDDYRLSPSMAPHYMSMNVFDEILESKNLALVRSDFHASKITKAEADTLSKLLLKCYADTKLFKYVTTLNTTPNEFDWKAFFDALPLE